jgi:hypothetical protein
MDLIWTVLYNILFDPLFDKPLPFINYDKNKSPMKDRD